METESIELMHRPKIKQEPQNTVEESQVRCFTEKCPIAYWIEDNICKKECIFFEKGDSEDICKCGYSKNDHVDEAENFRDELWDKHRHVHEVPTDAFGDISFGSLVQKTGKYARVSTDTSPKVLYQLLTEQWELSPPNLLISVIGGARTFSVKKFSMKSRLKNAFYRGLVKVAQTTGAWIITGGTDTGVMKYVGKAVKDYALSSRSKQDQIVAIGVATWGIIHNRKALVNTEGCFPAHYSMDSNGQGQLSCLNNNHTHFLLVDDGTHGKYGVEIELRSNLEKYISRKRLGNNESSVTIPLVYVVLSGGPGTLDPIYKAIMNGTPCVIFKGSGRMADVIAEAVAKTQVNFNLIDQLIKKYLKEENFNDLKIIKWTKQIQDIIRKSHLLTVFRISEDNRGEVDVAILQALLKASRNHESQACREQLELAMAWNRADIAETEIFTEESRWESSDLHWAMTSALVGNKPEFVRLLLENGVNLRDFLQDEKILCDLYNKLPTNFFLHKLVKRVLGNSAGPNAVQSQSISMSHVSDEVFHLLGNFTQYLYPPSTTTNDVNMSMEDISVSAEPQRDPGTDLFLWAVVQNNKEMAEIAWEQCKDCISAALAASKILKKMAEEGGDADKTKDMKALASHYEKHAIGVFNECYNSDEERAQKLLVRVSPSWGETTCLRLALEADDKSFVALSGVQALLTQIWCGELSVDNPLWRVLICMIFFPLIYTGFLTFRRDELIQRETERMEESKTMKKVTGRTLRIKRHDYERTSQQDLKPLGIWSKLVFLYNSPQVKFYWNIVSYFTFLLLFAVVLLIDFQDTPSAAEGLLYIWLFSLACEEVRQLFHDRHGFRFWKKAKTYIYNMWNLLDVLSIILFIIGLTFRLRTDRFYMGKVLFCIDFVVFCLRLTAIFTISRTLGPKIIIVKRMVMDMFFFMFMLSISVLAYGVAKQGILSHNDSRLDWIVRGAFYEPYLTIFGNFPKNIDYAAFDINSCSMNGTDPLMPKCPVPNQNPTILQLLNIIMLCVYLLFTNILLLNLLIAIFNFTFQKVQDNTDTIWKFQRYELIMEYHSRPAAPPPFIIFSHLYRFIKNVVLRMPLLSYHEFTNKLPENEEKMLLSWEALMKNRYLLSTKQEQSQSMEQRILDTVQKVSTITDWLEREEEMSSGTIKERLDRLEKQVKFSLSRPTCPEDSADQLDGNPAGRTRIRGQGALSNLGPNLHVDLVLTRWRDSDQSILEFLAVRDDHQQTFALPGGPVDSAHHLPVTLERTMGKNLFEKLNEQEGKMVWEGYVDDSRNTDDAWVETAVVNLHLDRTSEVMAEVDNVVADKHDYLQWQEVNRKTRLSSNQSDSLRRVAKLHNTKF